MKRLLTGAVLLTAWAGVVFASDAEIGLEQLHSDAALSKKAYRCAAIAYGAQEPEIQREAGALLVIGERALASAHAVFKQNEIADDYEQKSYMELLKSSSLEFWSGLTLARYIRDITEETGGLPKFDASSMDMSAFSAKERERSLQLNEIFASSNCAELLSE